MRRARQNSLQTAGNKEVIVNSTGDLAPTEAKSPPLEETLVTVEGQKLAITFSTKGAAITEAHIKDYDVTLPIKSIGLLAGFENVIFHVEKSSDRVIQFFYETEDNRINITYEISEDEYIVNQQVNITSLREMSKIENIDIRAISLDMSRLDIHKENFNREKGQFEYVVNAYSGVLRKNNAYNSDHGIIRGEFPDANICREILAAIRPPYGHMPYSSEGRGGAVAVIIF